MASSGMVIAIYMVAVISIFINMIFAGSVMVFSDLRRYVKMWYQQRFKYSKTKIIEAVILQPNRTALRGFFKIDQHGAFKPDKKEDATYTLDKERTVINEGGFPSGVWEKGNGTQIDLYGLSANDRTSADLLDSAIKMAIAAQGVGELFEQMQKLAKLSLWTFLGVLVLAGVVAIVAVVVFQMAGDVSAVVGGGTIIA